MNRFGHRPDRVMLGSGPRQTECSGFPRPAVGMNDEVKDCHKQNHGSAMILSCSRRG